jgi:alpha-beta hydrolase superfamily lysophospholipase
MVNSEHHPIIEEITFASDNYLLKGSLHLPPVVEPAVVIGCHGLLSDRTSPKQIALAQQCNLFNMAYFRIDHRGCGESQGPFAAVTSLDARCADLIAAAQMLRARDDVGDLMGLFGSSMGGAVCLAVAKTLDVKAIVTAAAPIRSKDLPHRQESMKNSNPPFLSEPFDISNRLKGIHSILIFHGDADRWVPLSHANEIYEGVDAPKKMVVFAKGDHRMSHAAHQQDFIRQATAWFKAHLINT